MNFFQQYRFIFIAISLILVSFIFFSLNGGRTISYSIFNSILLDFLAPIQKAVSSIGEWLGKVWNRYIMLIHVSQEVDNLKREVATYRQRLTDMEELKLTNIRLRALLSLKEKQNYTQVAAQVVGVDPTQYFRAVIIDKGSANGVEAQMAVVNAQGIVGRVIWSSLNYAKVLLLIDPNAAIDVLVQRSRARGILEGTGCDILRLKYVLRAEDVIAGDSLIATGVDKVFPKGILVGFVRVVKQENKGVFQSIEVEPAVNFTRLEEVIVILHRYDFDN